MIRQNREPRTLQQRMLNRLLQAEGWTQGMDLAEGLSTSPVAIETALAELVEQELAEYKNGVGYRLKGTVLCREAMRMLKRDKVRRCVKGQPFEGGYRLGVAEHQDGIGLVMYELEMPMASLDDAAAYAKQQNAIIKFSTKELAHG